MQVVTYESCGCCGGGGAYCGCDLPPTPLFLTVTGAVGGCACAIGESIELTYDSGNDWWQGSNFWATCGIMVSVTFWCDGSNWRLTVDAFTDCGATGLTATAVVCSPFSATFSGGFGSSCGCSVGSPTLTFTVTE